MQSRNWRWLRCGLKVTRSSSKAHAIGHMCWQDKAAPKRQPLS